MLNPSDNDYCSFESSDKPALIVVIDTEEEFDWSQTVARENTSVEAMRSIDRIQKVFDEYGITPVYVVDYPVASQPAGYEGLRDYLADGRCHIGAHLHPWVNPPYEETVNLRNSFPGNLPRAQESEKLRLLADRIEASFGRWPVIYKAGRYGIGPNTASILEQQGFEIDLSVRAHADFSDIEGPDFSLFSSRPYWFGSRRQMLEIPVAGGFSGLFRHRGAALHRIAMRRAVRPLRMRGIMKRLRLVHKLDMSPEASSLAELQTLASVLHDDGLRVFGFAFHSPSIEPGHTPYVRTDADLQDFITRCRGFFEWFLGPFGGVASDPVALRDRLRPAADRR